MNAGFRLDTIEVRNWGTFTGDCHFQMPVNGEGACFTGLNGSGKSTVIDALLTLLVPHEYRHFNVAATGAGAKRERTLKSYIMGAFSKEESVESASGQTKFLRRPGTLTVLLAVFRDAAFGRFVTVAQIHWVSASGEHHARFLSKEAECHIGDLGLANLPVTSFSAHFLKNGWQYDTTFAAYSGRVVGLLRIPSNEALRLFCRSVSLKDVPSVTEFVRSLMLEPQDTAAYLDGIEKHFHDLDHIHSELLATKAEIAWLEPVEALYAQYRTAADEVERLSFTRRAAQVVLAREAGGLLDGEISALNERKAGHHAEAERLRLVLDEVGRRILDIRVSLKTNSSYAAVERLRGEEEALRGELVTARKLLTDLTAWLQALDYKEPISTQAGFVRLQTKAGEMLAHHTDRHEQLLEQRGATLQDAKVLREQAARLDADVEEMSSKRTKIDRRYREMRDEICRELGFNEGLLPFVGELVDVPASEEPWRKTIEVLLHNFALSVVVPDDLYPQVAGYVERSQFRRRFTYFRAPRGTGAGLTLDNGRIYGKVSIRPDAWCRGWLQQALLRDFDHKCCGSIEDFKAEHGRAVTKNMHVKGGERSFKESSMAERDFDILGWSNEAKIAEFRSRLVRLRAEIATKEQSAATLGNEAKGVTSGLGLVRLITQITSFRSIDVGSIETEIAIAVDRRTELEANDASLRELTNSLKEAETESAQVSGLRDQEIRAEGEVTQTIEQRTKERASFGKRFNEAAADFDWRAWEADAMTFRGDSSLSLAAGAGLLTQIDSILNRIDVRSNASSRAMANAERDLGPKMTEFLVGTKGKGYAADWSPSVKSAPDMIAHLDRLRNEKFHDQEAQFKEQMDIVLEQDIDFAKHVLRGLQDANHQRIKDLNLTLATVDYNDGTFVEIRHRPSPDAAVANFRAKIEECTRRVIAMSPEQRTERFKAVKDLITYIRERRPEAERGANPNNWDIYVLAEVRRDNTMVVVNWHTDSDGNSGGQKAKLACTIVAAAMAFRMNHTRKKDSLAFRLVMVDEIFAKSDDVNSAYALRIFEQFDFQLLLVTPRDGRLKLVTPYVGAFHLFQNPTGASSTVVSITAAQVAAVQDTPVLEIADADAK